MHRRRQNLVIPVSNRNGGNRYESEPDRNRNRDVPCPPEPRQPGYREPGYLGVSAGDASQAESSPLPLRAVKVQTLTAGADRVAICGVNVAGMEWSSDGEGHILETVETAIRDWHVNHVRLPLAQDRWFGRAPEQKDEGKSYRALVKQAVEHRAKQGCYIVPGPALVGRGRVGQADRPAPDARPEQRGLLEGRRDRLQESPGRALRPLQRAARRQLGHLAAPAARSRRKAEGDRRPSPASIRPSACRRCWIRYAPLARPTS